MTLIGWDGTGQDVSVSTILVNGCRSHTVQYSMCRGRGSGGGWSGFRKTPSLTRVNAPVCQPMNPWPLVGVYPRSSCHLAWCCSSPGLCSCSSGAGPFTQTEHLLFAKASPVWRTQYKCQIHHLSCRFHHRRHDHQQCHRFHSYKSCGLMLIGLRARA